MTDSGRAEFARAVAGLAETGRPGTRSRPQGPGVLIEESAAERFAAAFAEAAAGQGPVFLCDPGWGAKERADALALIGSGAGAAPNPADPSRGWLMIPSGGTSGALKFARHDEATIAAAVRGYCAHFGATRASAVGVLPLHHVSGLMAWMRCALTGGTYLAWEWKRLEGGDCPARPAGSSFHSLSLVPTQLHRLLGSRTVVAWLRSFDAVFLGGGPAWPSLLEAAAAAGIPLAPSYGMTETAAMCAAVRPGEFQRGARNAGRPLPHADVGLAEDGAIRVAGPSVFLGYYPGWREPGPFVTEDLGAFDEHDRLSVLGRRDAMIVSGGKKVDPLEVEGILRASGAFEDVAVVGLPDPEWGQTVVACYPKAQRAPLLDAAERSVAALAAYKRPKRYLAIEPWPRNAQGKLNRAALAALVGLGA